MLKTTIKFLESEVQRIEATLAKRDLEIIKLKVEMDEMEDAMKSMQKRLDRLTISASKIIGGKRQ